MATASLGRLTLDLLVKLGSYEQGLNRAERQATQSANKMSDAFKGFGDQLRETLGGSQIGSIISDITTRLDGMKGSVLVATAGLAGMAVGGTALAVGGLSVMAIQAAKADANLAMLANRTNIGIKNFQVMTYAAEQLGISQDQLGSIFADVQEKLGEFSATGAGGAIDFFDALKNNTKLTDAQIKEFSRTLQGKDGIEAVQLLKDKLDELGASSQEQRFVFESLASDLGNLLPLFADGGELIKQYGDALEDAGLIKTKEAVKQSQLLAAQTQAVNLQFQGAKNQLVQGFMPAIVSVSDAMFGTSKNGVQLATVGDGLGTVFKILATLALGTSHVIQQVGNAFGAVAAMAVAAAKRDFASVVAIYEDSEKRVDDINSDMLDRYSKVWGPVTESSNTLVNALQSISNATTDSSTGLKVNTKEAEENAKAKEKAAKETEKLNKQLQVNAKVQSNAAKYNFAGIEDQYQLPKGLLSAINMQESRGNANAIGPMTKYGQAKGGFQFLDGTAKRFGLIGNAVFDTGKSAEAAAKYFQFLYEKFGSWEKAISAYHAGEGNVDRGTGLGPINREYVKNVLGYMDAALKGVGTTANDAIQYVDETYKAQQSIILKYLNEQEKLELEHAISIQEIREAFAENDPRLAKYITLQQAAYEKDVAEYQEAQKQKDLSDKKQLLETKRTWMTAGDYAREYYALVREEILNTASYSPEMKEALLQQAVSQQNFEQSNERDQAISDYRDVMGFEESPLVKQFEVLDKMRELDLINEEKYQQDKLMLQTKYSASYMESMLGGFAALVDENSSLYAGLFEAQKAFAVAQAMLNIPSAYSKAYDAVVGTPFVGPYIAPAVGAAAAALQVAQAASIKSVNLTGMAHDGINNIPEEGTWLLNKGERVLNPSQNRDLTNYLNQVQTGGQNRPIDNKLSVIMVKDEDEAKNYKYSKDFEDAVLYHMKRNRSKI